ncbi:MAG: bifunctional [glutamate--ammonia ligase]-adenylyl-L-tyrosine phosphorylase/[glutamate--ammonia-ligase] adenylyltransferase [Desulfobacteraceae bacterium]|nr:bifunctional [glutamate--ammonia ligase]-adenylyl-L-tyrosine phosphorylase/[glutamate--ammonia-ligase] adenylyltransferase [Desulfobacteraceae bacterium]
MYPTPDQKFIDGIFPNLDPSLSTLLNKRMNSFYESLENNGYKIAKDLIQTPELVQVMLFSEYIADNISRNPGIYEKLLNTGDLFLSYSDHTYLNRLEKAMSRENLDMAFVKETLLAVKLYESIRIAWRDLVGRAELNETLRDQSTLAEACVRFGFDFLYANLCQRLGTPSDANGNFQQIIVLGMGKLGAWELNFSSDIDLIFVYPRSGYTTGKNPISNDEFFTKLCRDFLKLFTMGGGTNFFRVDTRLRPFGAGGPLVMSATAFEDYYQAQGREWERYAMIKARPIAGDIDEGHALLKALKPFVYRRYFDYGSFDSFREMKHRITLQVKNAKLKNNIKLGAGGIREIEFFGQLFQLIRGGVEPGLQEQQILKVLKLLQIHQCINKKTKEHLKSSYLFLRLVENRLQEYRDRQTHDIPVKADQRLILALSMGFDSFEAFNQELSRILNLVHGHFSQLLVTQEEENTDTQTQLLREMWTNINDPQFTSDAVEVAGYGDPDQVLSILKTLACHPNTQRLTPNGRKKLARLMPMLVKKAGQKDEAQSVLNKLIDLVITIERRTCYLSLLIENKGALDTLIILARKSPWIITFLSQHPVLLDELMHPATLYAPPKKHVLEKEMADRMAKIAAGDVEYLLEELCIFCQINTLRVAAADVSGNYPLMKVSDHLTYIAETVLTQVLKISWDIVTQKYGLPTGVKGKIDESYGFAIVAYGKVGGLEMGYKSDLDLVFLYQAEPGMTSGGKGCRTIDNIRFYSNLGQRIINALTIHTSAGKLYGADMRLRPGGSSGMIVSHIDAFEDYLENQAWTWEHQALIRARPITGDPALFSRFNKIREKVLKKKRDPATLQKEVNEMRQRLREKHLSREKGQFDLKQDMGAIVDIEFLVQYLILKNAHDFSDITVWTDNIRLMESLSLEAIISGAESQILQEAYVDMRRVIHRLTLQEKALIVPDNLFLDTAKAVRKIYNTHITPERKDQESKNKLNAGQ